MDLPKRIDKHVTGEQAVAAVKLALPSDWICREQTSDYGIDLEIEIVSGGQLTGQCFKAQVKGHQTIDWNKGDAGFTQGIKASTKNYWSLLDSPVVLLLADTTTNGVFWSAAEGDSPIGNSGGCGVKVFKQNRLPGTASELRDHVTAWMSQRRRIASLLTLPDLTAWLDGRECELGYDGFMVADEDAVAELRRLYGGTSTVRTALGLEAILPWWVWLARSSKLFPKDHEHPKWMVHDEVTRYLRLRLDEVLKVAKLAIKDTPNTPMLNEIRHFLDGLQVVTTVPADSLNDDTWKRLEALLTVEGVIKR